jgi:serine/threonine-protein kinase
LEGLAAPALEAVERTEALAPGSLEAIKARAWYTYYVEDDFRRALELMHEAERMAPSDTDVLRGIAYLQHRVGEFAEGTQTMKRAVDLDPLNSGTLSELAGMLGRLGRWEAADEVVERALAMDPSNTYAQLIKIEIIVRGDRDPGRARSLAAEMGLDATTNAGADLSYHPAWYLAWFATLERDYDGAALILADAPPYDETSSTARIEKLSILTLSVWVEQMRGGDPRPLRDSLTAFLDPDSTVAKSLWTLQAEALLLTGQEEAGWALLVQSVEEARSSQDQLGPINDFWEAALIYAQFGRPEEAFALLDEAVARPSDGWWSVADLELDPSFDSLRDDPRFGALMARQEAYEAQAALDAEADGPWLP